MKIANFRLTFDTHLMIKHLPSLVALLISTSALAAPRELQSVIDDYINEGMRSNLALQGETYAVQEAKASLDAARAHYFPELSLDARYTWSHGGREISLPIGDALNPVYTTLNQMLEAQGQQGSFPHIDNVTIPFLRPHEQDTHISVRQ